MKVSKKILALSLAACMTVPFFGGCGSNSASDSTDSTAAPEADGNFTGTMVIGGIGTLLYQLLSYGVTATTALWIAPYVLLGLCVGAVSARHGYACTKRQLVLLVVFGELGITALNTASLYIDSLIYGYYSPVFVFGTLPLRLGICAAKAVVFSLLLPSLLPLVRRAVQPHAN